MIRWLINFLRRRRHEEQSSLDFWLQREAKRLGDARFER